MYILLYLEVDNQEGSVNKNIKSEGMVEEESDICSIPLQPHTFPFPPPGKNHNYEMERDSTIYTYPRSTNSPEQLKKW